jgi:branched-chain amino acid transport system substrate-binding protein
MSVRVIALGGLVCLLVGACATSVQAPQAEIIITSDFPSSAEPKNITALQEAIQLAVDQKRTVRGYRLGYMPFDDSLGAYAWPEKGLQNLKRMFGDARVLGMVGPHQSYMALQEIPRATDHSFVMISGSATRECLTVAPLCDADLESVRKNLPTSFFRIAPPDPVQGRAMAHLAAQLNIKRVAAINTWTGPPFGLGQPYVKQFEHELAAQGGQMVMVRDVARPTHDYSSFLSLARAAGAEAIYAVGDSGSGLCDIRSQMGTDFKYLFFTDGITGDDDCLKSGTLVPATYGTFGAVDATQSSDPATMKIVAAFHKAYPHAPNNDLYTFAAYDCARILITAIERAIDVRGGGVPTRQEVLRQVASGQFDGGATGNYKFLPNGDAASPTMSIWGVKDNHWYYMNKIDASAAP